MLESFCGGWCATWLAVHEQSGRLGIQCLSTTQNKRSGIKPNTSVLFDKGGELAIIDFIHRQNEPLIVAVVVCPSRWVRIVLAGSSLSNYELTY